MHKHRTRQCPVFIPLAYEPGMDAQVDFGEARVIMKGRPVTVQLFVGRLCFSKIPFLVASLNQQQEALFEGHEKAFDFFGGVPRTIWYDRLSQEVMTMTKEMLSQHHLKRLRLPTMGHQYEKLAQEAARDNRPYEDFLLGLLEAEVAQREENTRKRLIAQAHFPYISTLDQFDFSIIHLVNKAGVLELSKGDYLSTSENVVLIGNMGTGKTHTAIALGLLACQMGKRVRFYTATALLNEFLEAQDQHSLGKRLAQLARLDLLIVDEVGFVPFTPEGSLLLFQALSERYLKGSLLITSNLEFSRWLEVFGDERLTEGLMHVHCHPFNSLGL
ncbi:MAG TPA: ATP-binding protein [Dehalococcoidia bacterium]|nr:ATP-binding protein [Dehalococcoidia bacterium]